MIVSITISMIIMMVSNNNAIMISPYRLGTSLHRGPFTKWGIATSGMWRGSWASSSLQMSHSPLRMCKSIPLNGLGNWSAIPGEHEDGLKLCERRVMRAMLSWNVVTANETDKLRPAVLFDIIISFASAFILATFKSKKKKKKTWLCLIWSEHFFHFRECCDIGRSGLRDSWAAWRVAFLDDILICFLPSVLINLSISSSPRL